MQESKVSLFKQKNNVALTVLCIVLCLVLSPAVGATMLLPQVIALLPVLLLAMLSYIGPVSAVACCAVLVLMAFSLFGIWGAVCIALVIVPSLVVSGVTLEREQPFWLSVAASAVTMFASMGVGVALLSYLAGSDVVTALSGGMQQMLDTSGAMGDLILTLLMQMGVIAAPEGFDAAVGVASLDAATRESLLSALVMTMDTVLRLEIPMQMATGSIAAGLLGQAALRKGVIARGTKVEYPPLRSWLVPSGWGRVLGGTLALLYVIEMIMSGATRSMLYVFSGVFDQVFALQGIASLCYLLHEKGKGRKWQTLVFILGYFILRQPAVMVGILDQALDFTQRRKTLEAEENRFDPRAGL